MYNLAEFILWMQKPSGQFYSTLSPDSFTFSEFESEYYPGEALLSLIRLFKLDNNDEWINAAEKGAYYLINVRDHNKTVEMLPPDHWLTIALSELYELSPTILYRNHITKLTDSIVYSLTSFKSSYTNKWYDKFTSAQMATRAEGLGAAIELEINLKNRNRSVFLLELLEQAISFCISLQYTTNSQNSIYVVGGFKCSITNPRVRIDYAQHAVCAMLQYKKDTSLFTIVFPSNTK